MNPTTATFSDLIRAEIASQKTDESARKTAINERIKSERLRLTSLLQPAIDLMNQARAEYPRLTIGTDITPSHHDGRYFVNTWPHFYHDSNGTTSCMVDENGHFKLFTSDYRNRNNVILTSNNIADIIPELVRRIATAIRSKY